VITRTLEAVPNGKHGVDIRVDLGNRSEQWWLESVHGKPLLSAYLLHQVDGKGVVAKTLKHYLGFFSLSSFHLTKEGSKHLSRRPPVPSDVLVMASKWLRERRIANLEKALALAKKL